MVSGYDQEVCRESSPTFGEDGKQHSRGPDYFRPYQGRQENITDLQHVRKSQPSDQSPDKGCWALAQ